MISEIDICFDVVVVVVVVVVVGGGGGGGGDGVVVVAVKVGVLGGIVSVCSVLNVVANIVVGLHCYVPGSAGGGCFFL